MSALLPGPAGDFLHALRQLKGTRTSLKNLRTGIQGEADALVLEALVTLDCVRVDLEKARRIASAAARKSGERAA